MTRAPLTLLLLIITTAAGLGTVADTGAETGDQTAMELGHKVLAVMEAIQNPETPNAMQAVTSLGHDQRYYVMVRGWLQYKLDGDRSILHATGGQSQTDIVKRVRFLEQAIRIIDLE